MTLGARIEAIARRTETDRFFLGSALKDYAVSEHLRESELADELGCAPDSLDLLRLCRLPSPLSASFHKDINKIALRFSARPDIIAKIVRYSDVLQALIRKGSGERGWLAAARDREDSSSDAESSSEEEDE